MALLAQQRELMAEQQQRVAAAPRPRAGTLHWLLLAAAGYGQSLLSRADVAALFLSRKILLTGVGSEEGGAVSRAGGWGGWEPCWAGTQSSACIYPDYVLP